MNKKYFGMLFLLGLLFISACAQQRQPKSYGPFTTECKFSGDRDCKSTSDCSNTEVGLSACEHFCINKQGYGKSIGARGYEEGSFLNKKIMCECTCADDFY